ncbi:MAG TPA: hypothetical protein DDY13_12495 [Cytophagales bacterium]|jgi:hypothetical protein|nr:hypothetical protein [Cytophagales bacterium]
MLLERVIRFVRNVSVILFLGVLLLVYAYLHENPTFYLDENQQIGISLNSFFYGSLIIFAFANLFLNIMLSFSDKIAPGMRSGLFFRSAEMKANFRIWLYGFNAATNFFLLSIVGYLGLLNSSDQYGLSGYRWVVYMGPVFVVIILIGLILMLGRGRR